MTSHGVRSSSEVLEGEIVRKRPFWRPKLSFNNFFKCVYSTTLSTVRVVYVRRCINVKLKAVPLQAWSGPEGSRKLRFPDYMTTAQDVCKIVSLTHRPPLPPGNAPGTHFC
jgi:hypothetical protein